MITQHKWVAALLACLSLASPVLAQENTATAPGANMLLELNGLRQGEAGCLVTLLATNQLGAPLNKLTYEFAFFDQAGVIDRLLLIDFKALSQGKSKVLQIPLGGLECGNLTRVLVNGAPGCEGPGLDAGACLDRLTTSAKPKEITFGI